MAFWSQRLGQDDAQAARRADTVDWQVTDERSLASGRVAVWRVVAVSREMHPAFDYTVPETDGPVPIRRVLR
jgi:hypothetical protein